MAGQIKIEMERQEEKMKELGEEIQRTGELPPDARLRDYYDLDDDAIADLKREFQMKDSEPEPEPELPELPPAMCVPPPVIAPLCMPTDDPTKSPPPNLIWDAPARPAPPAPPARPASPPPPKTSPPKEYGPQSWADQPIC
jgi:hypothetical protein